MHRLRPYPGLFGLLLALGAWQTAHVLELNGCKISEVLDVNWNTAGFSWTR
jgi:hypothetical protein